MDRLYAEQRGEEWVTGNGLVQLFLGIGTDGLPGVRHLKAEATPGVDWAVANGGGAAAPAVDVGGSGELEFVGFETLQKTPGLRLRYRASGGLLLIQHLRCVPGHAVITS